MSLFASYWESSGKLVSEISIWCMYMQWATLPEFEIGNAGFSFNRNSSIS